MATMNPNPSTRTPLRRLPGASPSVRRQEGARATLWLDDKQLVQELVRSYTLEIQRFALTDLHAIQFRHTSRGLIYNLILLATLVLMGLRLPTILSERGAVLSGHLFFWTVLVLLAVALVVNIVRGPTCRATLTTALGPQELFSLGRIKTARRALLLIAANVAAIQGAMRPDEAAQAVDRARTQTPISPTPAGPARAAATFREYHY